MLLGTSLGRIYLGIVPKAACMYDRAGGTGGKEGRHESTGSTQRSITGNVTAAQTNLLGMGEVVPGQSCLMAFQPGTQNHLLVSFSLRGSQRAPLALLGAAPSLSEKMLPAVALIQNAVYGWSCPHLTHSCHGYLLDTASRSHRSVLSLPLIIHFHK